MARYTVVGKNHIYGSAVLPQHRVESLLPSLCAKALRADRDEALGRAVQATATIRQGANHVPEDSTAPDLPRGSICWECGVQTRYVSRGRCRDTEACAARALTWS